MYNPAPAPRRRDLGITQRRVSLESFEKAREPVTFLLNHVNEMLRDAGISAAITATVQRTEPVQDLDDGIRLRLEKF
ncbi:MAG: hypothetical protein OXC11_00830 [Rhodospirillales bacterium]|nr:hypothetical protein [Rhodospirillales bacterium]